MKHSPAAVEAVEIQIPEVVPLDTLTLLLPDDTNHNVISPFKFDGLKSDIQKYGFDEPLQVWDSDGKLWVVNGHKRYAALKSLGAPDCLIVRKRFKSRAEALAYSVRRNEERGHRDDTALASVLNELNKTFETVEDMSDALSLTERELYDAALVDKTIELPKGKRGASSRGERSVVKVQLSLTVDTKAALDRALKKAWTHLRDTGNDPDDLPLPHSVALDLILKRWLDS